MSSSTVSYGHGGPGEAAFWARMAQTPEGQAAKAANNARRAGATKTAYSGAKNKKVGSLPYGKHYGNSRRRKTRRNTRRNRRY